MSADLWHVRCLWDSSLTSPTMAGSKVGSWYTARSLVFSAPVANRVWEGFKAILWIPQGHSAGILFLLLFREGMWNCFPVLVSRTISWNWVGNLMELRQIFYQQNKFLHTIHMYHSPYLVTFSSHGNLSIIQPVRWEDFIYLPQFKFFFSQ